MSSNGGAVANSEPQQQYCSPPPKPPRRRHSDQLAKSSGSSLTNQKKHFNGSLPLSSRSCGEKHFSSGSDSLPASWILHDNQEREGKIYLKDAKLNSLPRKIVNCPSLKSSTSRKIISNQTGSSVPEYDSSILKCHLNLDKTQSYPANAVDVVPNVLVPSVQKECDFTLSENLTVNGIDTEVLKCGDFPKSFHRRHHSDPILPRLNRSFRTMGNNAKVRSGNHGLTPTSLSLTVSLNSPQKYDAVISEEMKVLKETNDKLWQHLCFVQDKLDEYQKPQTSPKSDHASSPSFAELICDIYNAQKEKDSAIEKRLKTAMDERDAAIKTLEELLLSITQGVEDCDLTDGETEAVDEEFKTLFQQLESEQHPVKLLQQQRNLLTYLYRSKENKLQRLSNELNLCIEERKRVTEKVEKLEDELIKWKTSRCLLHSDVRQWETNLLDALCEVITQRDSALAKARYYQEQLQLYQIHHSHCELQKPSSNDVHSSDYESLQKLDSSNKNSEDISTESIEIDLDDSSSANNFESSSDESKYLRSKINYLTKSLDSETKRRQTAEENCHKLERLVLLLRRKINGINVGIPV